MDGPWCEDPFHNQLAESTLFGLAILFNSLVLFMVCTTKQYTEYTIMVKVSCVLDMVNGLVKEVLQLRAFSHEHVVFIQFQNPLLKRFLNNEDDLRVYSLVALYDFIFVLSPQLLVLPFYCRYRTVCGGRYTTRTQYLLMVCVCIGGGVVFGSVNDFLNDYTYREYRRRAVPELMTLPCLTSPIYPVKGLISFSAGFFVGLIQFTPLVPFVLSYGAILFYFVKVRQVLPAQPHSTGRLALMRRQFNRAMMLQAAVPLMTGFVPLVISILTSRLQIQPNVGFLVLQFSMSAVNFVNPLVILVSVSALRNRLLRPFDKSSSRV